MKYTPEKVFVKENNEYVEISYSELCKREATDESYNLKKFLPLHGMLMEVDEEFYEDFYRQKNRDEYLTWRTKNKDVSYQDYDTEDCSGEDMLVDPDEDIVTQVTDKLMAEHVRYVVSLLPSDERELIEALFFKGYSERQWSRISGVPQRTICYRKNVILQKLKKILKN